MTFDNFYFLFDSKYNYLITFKKNNFFYEIPY